MIPCFLPGLTFLLWAGLLQFGLPFQASVIPFAVAEGLVMIAQAEWRRRLDEDERLPGA